MEPIDIRLSGTNQADFMQISVPSYPLASGHTGYYALAGNDTVYGNQLDNYLNGGVGNDYLNGEGGNDILIGDVGNDILIGGRGKDYLVGGDGNDTLFGGSGKDYLIGGSGNDILVGGSGADIFYFALTQNAGVDSIKDFSIAEGDRLKVLASERGSGVSSSQFNYNSKTGDLAFNSTVFAQLDTGLNFQVTQHIELV